MTVEVTGYKYRWFDSMMIVMPADDDKPLYIYTPSECIFHDGGTRFYSYRGHIEKRERKAITSIYYDPNKKYGMDCDGTATFIEYDSKRSNGGIPWNVDIWAKYNDDEKTEKARNAAMWGGFAKAICAIAKPMYDAAKDGAE